MRKNVNGYIYRGDLAKEIKRCEAELDRKINSDERSNLKWLYERSKREYEKYEQRISDLRRFIELAKEKLGDENNG